MGEETGTDPMDSLRLSPKVTVMPRKEAGRGSVSLILEQGQYPKDCAGPQSRTMSEGRGREDATDPGAGAVSGSREWMGLILGQKQYLGQGRG